MNSIVMFCAKLFRYLRVKSYLSIILPCKYFLNYFTTLFSGRLINDKDIIILHKSIHRELSNQRKHYKSYSYANGYLYQSCDLLRIVGLRSTEARYNIYSFDGIIKENDRVLDIGCNSGFISIYLAIRTGCVVHGIDINPYMISVGEHCIKYLRMESRVKFFAGKIQEFYPKDKYNVILSFATHWTDDKNYRVGLYKHFQYLYNLLEDFGVVIFESHSKDVGNDSFYDSLDEVKKIFRWECSKLHDGNSREVFIMHKITN